MLKDSGVGGATPKLPPIKYEHFRNISSMSANAGEGSVGQRTRRNSMTTTPSSARSKGWNSQDLGASSYSVRGGVVFGSERQ